MHSAWPGFHIYKHYRLLFGYEQLRFNMPKSEAVALFEWYETLSVPYCDGEVLFVRRFVDGELAVAAQRIAAGEAPPYDTIYIFINGDGRVVLYSWEGETYHAISTDKIPSGDWERIRTLATKLCCGEN